MMGLYSPAFFSDQELLDEIKQWAAARKKASMQGIGVVAGEGRRMEFTSRNVPAMDAELRVMLAEALSRGLAVGPPPCAIGVEFY